jgi:hypothetical protein
VWQLKAPAMTKMSTLFFQRKLLQFPIVCLLIALTFFASCGYKKLMKEAKVYEEGKLASEALTTYQLAYLEYNKAEAKVSMKRVAQSILDEKIRSAKMAFMSQEYVAALSHYDEAYTYADQHSQLDLSISDMVRRDRAECLSSYVNELYQIAEKQVLNEDFEGAHATINKILSVDRNNQQAKFLEIMCDIVPSYQAGLKAVELQLWRQAYAYFDEVCKIDADYKDAFELREEAMLKSKCIFVFKPEDNKSVDNNVESTLATTIKGSLLDIKNPFIELVERDNLDVVIKEQQETMSPQYEEGTGSQAGKLKKANYIISAEFVNFKSEMTPEKKKTADVGFDILGTDKVECYEISGKRILTISYKYSIIDVETGKLYFSDVINFSDSDDFKRFEVNVKKSIGNGNGWLDRKFDLSKLKRKEDPLKSEEEMLASMNAYIAEKINISVQSFNP